jgi:hypothetical protein
LALLGAWGLLAWIFGFPLGGEIRSDPFRLDDRSPALSRLADGFLSTIPHPALARMEVVPSGVVGALTPRPMQETGVGAAAPEPSFSELVNAPETALGKIRDNLGPGPAAASREDAPPRGFVIAGMEPLKKDAPASKTPPNQKAPPRKGDGKQVPFDLFEPPIEQRPVEPNLFDQRAIESDPADQKGIEPEPVKPQPWPLPTEPAPAPAQTTPPTPEKPVLLAALFLTGKDGKDRLVAIDTATNIYGLDENGARWRLASQKDDSLGINSVLQLDSIRDVAFGVGYALSSSWLLFQSGSADHVAPVFYKGRDLPFSAPFWSNGSFELRQISAATGSKSLDGLEIELAGGLRLALAQVPFGALEQPTFYATSHVPGSEGHWSIWASGKEGILEIKDSNDLVLHRLPVNAAIRSVFFQSPTQGWATSGWNDGNPEGTARPVVLETRDAGQTWQYIPYRWLPAPWVFFAFVLAVGAFWRGTAAHAARARVPARLSIAEHGVSDNPIGLDDPDALGFVPIAKAMSRFLRNVQTTPSLAIGVSGPWGSGKSSLMRLVREDLEDRGIRTIEFNAWHHQQEESLLAALLTVVRAGAVPPVWTWSGLRVRGSSFWRHLRANPFLVIGLLAISALLGLGIWALGPRLTAWLQGPAGEPADTSTLWGALGFSASAIAMAKILWAVFQPLSAMPSKLLSTVSARSSRRDVEQQLAFRYCFQQEFSTFCSALRRPPHPGLVIFVDDLDRCGPRQTVDILEALNFVSTAGNCFIILGFDEQKVKAAIANVYKDTLLELQDTDTGSVQEARKDELFRFATNYLEKLVHLVVPVPRTTNDAVEKLLGLKPVPPPSREERTRRRVRHRAAEAAIPILLLSGLATMAVAVVYPLLPSMAQIETWRHPHPDNTGETQAKSERPSETQPDGTAPELGAKPPVPGGTGPTRKFASVEPSYLEWIPAWAYVLVLLILFLLPIAWLTRRFSEEAIVDDSPSFREALSIWDDLIAARRQTPRAIKRFMNRLRFLAMRVRDVTQEEDACGGASAPLDEPLLVTYAAMEELGETEPNPTRQPAGGAAQDLKAQLAQGIEAFTMRFHRNPHAELQSREVYRRIAGIVEERGPADTAAESASPMV